MNPPATITFDGRKQNPNDPNVRSYYFLPDELKVVRGEGVYVYTEDGRRYLDCSAGTFNLSLGYSHPEVVEAIRDQAGKLIHVTSKFQTDPNNALVRALAEVAPPGLTKVHLKASGGSDANEGAIKIAQHVTGKSDVISLFRGHYGQTIGMIQASGAGLFGFLCKRGFSQKLKRPGNRIAKCETAAFQSRIFMSRN